MLICQRKLSRSNVIGVRVINQTRHQDTNTPNDTKNEIDATEHRDLPRLKFEANVRLFVCMLISHIYFVYSN